MAMKQTVIGVFGSPLRANEVVHILVRARFEAERLPRIAEAAPAHPHPAPRRLLESLARRFRDIMDADRILQPYASALAKGRFIVKVHAADNAEAIAAQRILEAAGGREIDLLVAERGHDLQAD